MYAPPAFSPTSHNATLLAVLKAEIFAIESENRPGSISPEGYKEQKTALETVLQRALEKLAN
jgi:hypothetical protein